MTRITREAQLLQTFARLADTLVDDYDVVDLLQSLVDACRDLLNTTAAGILLADGGGELELVASTSEASRLVEVMQLSAHDGPCIECYQTGAPISVPAIADSVDEWPAFGQSALEQGFASAEAIPLRLRESTIGTLNLLRSEEGPADEADMVAARAFADVATIGILHERSLRESEVLSEQLQIALNSRVVIEQAKGVVSFTNGVPVDEAFDLIRAYARRHQLPLRDVAARLVRRELELRGDS
jgi:transcriptional regulator with GAF, ATPase, and Fis domain